MKKLYFLTLGLLCTSLATQAQDVVTIGEVSYPSFNDAWTAAVSGNELIVNENVSFGDLSRLEVSNDLIVRGLNPEIELIRNNTKQPQFFLFKIAGKSLTLQNLIFNGNNERIKDKADIISVEAKNSVLTLSNVTVKNVTTTSEQVINIKPSQGAGSIVNIENVKFVGSVHSNESVRNCDIPVNSAYTVNIKGNNDAVFTISAGAKLNVTGDLTNEKAVALKLNGVLPGDVVVANCSTPSKFELVDPDTDYKLVAENGNLVVRSESYVAPVTVTTDIEAAGVSNAGFSSLVAAIDAVKNYNSTATEKIGAATISLGENQTIDGNLRFNDVDYVFKPADGKEISIIINTTDKIGLYANTTKSLTFENLTFTGVEGKTMSKNPIEVAVAGSVLNLNNVVVKGMSFTNENAYIVQVKTNGKININNVTVTDCNGITAFAFIGTGGSSVTGNSNTSFLIELGTVNAAGWNPTEKVDITRFGTKINNDAVLFSNFTGDINMLNMTSTGFKIELDGTDVKLIDTTTGIDDVTVSEENAPVEYYNLQGVRAENPAPGLYIKRQGTKATKVIIR